ncbi:MAG TPA: hypothetical protein PKE32_06930 [Miltoncostaeaceae bacterium]|nr:hypothetical protein [Miltoncostaeaceae bacterium]
MWLSATVGGGPAAAAAIIAASVLPLAFVGPPAALAVARGSRRRLMAAAQIGAGGALLLFLIGPLADVPPAMAATALLMGITRAVFDATAADVLLHLVARSRTHAAMSQLTRRFGAGQALGVAGVLALGALFGPRGALGFAVAAALTGAAVTLSHSHHIELRPEGVIPLPHAVRAGVRVAGGEPLLRGALLAGALSVAIGAALSTILVLWLRNEVGLHAGLIPALALGFVGVRLVRPALRYGATRSGPRGLIASALTIQAAAALVAYAAGGVLLSAAAFALSLASGAFVGALISSAQRAAAPTAVAPGVALVGGAVWASAGAGGAAVGAWLSLSVGMGATYLLLAAVALAAAGASLAPAIPRAVTHH